MTISDPPAPVDPAGENALDELVDYFNARDFDAVASLLDADVSFPWLEVAGRDGTVTALADLSLRNPGLVFTRGELEEEPVVVAWVLTGVSLFLLAWVALAVMILRALLSSF